MIDFKALKAKVKPTSPLPLFAVIIGCPTSGKSTLTGTMRLPTLYLHFLTEDHGATNAGSIKGSEIHAVDVTVIKADGTTDADATYNNLLAHIKAPDLADHFGCIVIDGATELEQVIRKSTLFLNRCKALSGKHNTYAETGAVVDMFKDVVEILKGWHKKSIHVLFTLAGMSKQADASELVEITPVLQGYGVALEFLKNFNDVLLVSRITKELEDGSTKTGHALLFKGNIVRSSKDIKTGQILKSINFSPRLSGILIEDLPELFKADLSLLLKRRVELMR